MQAIVYWIVNTCTCVNDKNAGVFFYQQTLKFYERWFGLCISYLNII